LRLCDFAALFDQPIDCRAARLSVQTAGVDDLAVVREGRILGLLVET
jgi:hypothetical protein